MELKDAEILVVKVGTSTLTYENGKSTCGGWKSCAAPWRICKTPGASWCWFPPAPSAWAWESWGFPAARRKQRKSRRWQLLASDTRSRVKFFGEYNHTVAQVLLTADVVDFPRGRENVQNTFRELLSMGVIPVVNENDTWKPRSWKARTLATTTPCPRWWQGCAAPKVGDPHRHRRPVHRRPPERSQRTAHPPGGGDHPGGGGLGPAGPAPTGAPGAWPPS